MTQVPPPYPLSWVLSIYVICITYMFNTDELLAQYNLTHIPVKSVVELGQLLCDIDESIVDHLQVDTPDDITFESEVLRLTGFTVDEFDFIIDSIT